MQLPAAAPCALCGGSAQLPHMNCANIDCNRLFLACAACRVRGSCHAAGHAVPHPLQLPSSIILTIVVG
jgi:hypothetical protein